MVRAFGADAGWEKGICYLGRVLTRIKGNSNSYQLACMLDSFAGRGNGWEWRT